MPKSVFLFCKSTSPSATQLGLLLVLVLFSFSLACQTQTAADTNKSAAGAADTRAADEATLRKLDDDWSKAAAAKDVEKTASFYSDDALVMPPNSPVLKGKDAAREMWNRCSPYLVSAVVGERRPWRSRSPAIWVTRPALTKSPRPMPTANQ